MPSDARYRKERRQARLFPDLFQLRINTKPVGLVLILKIRYAIGMRFGPFPDRSQSTPCRFSNFCLFRTNCRKSLENRLLPRRKAQRNDVIIS